MTVDRASGWRRLLSGSACTVCGVCTVCAALAASLAACSGDDRAGGTVVQADRAHCGQGWGDPRAGTQTLRVHNSDSASAEVDLIDPSSGAIYAELEGVGPGTTRSMRVTLGGGTYAFWCFPEGGHPVTGPRVAVRGPAGGPAVRPVTQNDLFPALRSYRAYVTKGLGVLRDRTDELRDAVRSGDLDAARGKWLPAHLAYERLGAAYGTFGDFADKIDGRPAGLPGGVHDSGFTGFRRVEYGLWHGESAASLRKPADQLAGDVRALIDDFPREQIDPTDLGLRAHEILENTVQFELTGKGDQGSGTALATASANLEGTRAVLDPMRPVLKPRMDLTGIDTWLGRTAKLLEAQHEHGRWTPLDELSTTDREHINGAVGELVERLASVATVAAVRRTS
ncbi:EfeM/EfeO family lipoprotein [Actinomadura opuntiae]|uniref:EfeM/EfeO family lipoprotein n=1 Tax=Actinomadura sp. OS1-43 TaxID=604315 RepID=UPI00255B1E42|nr:EfeM/EfeO family lipoprotein [Actinomadura sp. OS1-43]MDL4814928.1 EfeM/EfeO family lipoprotein [Actinomadura sp. OS1-43]